MKEKKPLVIEGDPIVDEDIPLGAEGFGDLGESALERLPPRTLDVAERALQRSAQRASQTFVSDMKQVRRPLEAQNPERIATNLGGWARPAEQIPDKYRLKPGGFDPVRRCSADDIIRFAPKVVSRLRERFPRISESNFISHYTAILAANWAIVICSDTAIAAATAFSTWYEPELVVQDSLICAVEPATGGADLIRLYKRIEEWARSIGAVEMTIGSMTEKDLGPLAQRLGYNMVSRGFSKRLRE